MNSKRIVLLSVIFGVLAIVATACTQPQTVPVEVTRLVEIDGTPQVIVETVEVPVSVSAPERDTMVVCLGQEPETLYLYGGTMLASSHIYHGLYDGPIDNNTFDYQPVIITQIPTLDSGGTVINTVTANEGDLVVGDDGNPTVLELGVLVRPAGCRSGDCAIEYAGGELELDQMVVTFELVEGLSWSDGTPLTANDSVFSYNLAAEPDTPAPKFVIDRTASYVATDERTVVWTGLPGNIDATYFLNFFQPLPEHIYGQFSPDELLTAEESSRLPLAYGPYQITAWEAGQFIEMVKNPFYFRASEGLPKIERILFRFVGANSNANIAALLSGDCDIVDQTSSMEDQSELLLELQASGQLVPSFVTGTTWEHLDFIVSPADTYSGFSANAAFEDLRLRRAVAHCLDREAVVDSVMFGQSAVVHTYLPPEHPLFNDSVQVYDFDVTVGSALLDEIGWVDDDGDPTTPRVAQGVSFTGQDGQTVTIPDGTPLRFRYGSTNATLRIQSSQVLQQSLLECGIVVDLEYYAAAEWFSNYPDGPVFGRRYDVAQFAWNTGVIPPCALYISSQIATDENAGGQNNTGWSNAAYDEACGNALQSLYGTPEYDQFHLQAQSIFAENLPVVPLFLRLKLAVARPEVTGFIVDPTTNSEFWNIENFGFSE